MLQHIIDQLIATSLLEWLAFIFGVLQVVLAWQNKTLNFYAGIVSVCLYTWLFYESGLYAESLLNAYYFIVSVAGIFMWSSVTGKKLPVEFATRKVWLMAGALFLVLFVLQYLVLSKHTNSTVPLADAFVAASAWAGCWMLIKRVVENWLVLNISNLIAIPLQWYKGMELTAVFTFILFVVAVLGYVRWRREALSGGE